MRVIQGFQRFLRRNASLLFATYWLTGCATSPDVKSASAELAQTLNELQSSTDSFQTMYVAEVERIRQEIALAIEARVVKLEIETLSAQLSEGELDDELQGRGLIAISERVEAAQMIARGYVDDVLRFEPETREDGSEESSSEAYERFLRERRASVKLTITELAGQMPAADNEEPEANVAPMEERDSQLGEVGGETLNTDPWAIDADIESHCVQLIELRGLIRDMPTGLDQLRLLLDALQEIHGTVHDWIMTDVEVSGEDAAGVLQRALQVSAPGSGDSR